MKNWIILVNRYKAIGQQYDKLLYNCHSVMLVCVLLFQEATDSSVHAWVWKVLPNKYTGWAIVITFRSDECCSTICTWKPCRELVTNVACRTIAQSYGVQQKTDSLSKVSRGAQKLSEMPSRSHRCSAALRNALKFSAVLSNAQQCSGVLSSAQHSSG